MALSTVAAGAARAAPKVAKILKGAPLPLPLPTGEEEDKPSIFSPEGVIMLLLAGMFELANVILAILDIIFGIGTVIAPVVNGLATFFIGGWLYFRTGQLPIKKALLPFGLNILPIIRFFPFWLWSVWSSCKKT